MDNQPVLLINPYYSQTVKYNAFTKPTAPLSLMYLASYLKKYGGINCRIIELGVFSYWDSLVIGDRIRFGVSDDKIREIIKAEKPGIVGITSMYSLHYGDVLEIATTIKKVDSRIKIVLGGNHASLLYNSILKNPNIDVTVIGEGERTFLELCQVLPAGGDLQGVRGIAYRKGDRIIRTEPRELIENLDEIPFPERDTFDFSKYYVYEREHPYLMRYPATTIITSRGCPGKCIFCTVRAVWGRTWRGRSPENVVDEIELLVNKYGIKTLALNDDTAGVNKQRWNAILDEIIRRKIDIKWHTPNGISHWTLDKELLKKMKKAGFDMITFGIESGNEETRRFIGKTHSLEQAREVIREANRAGMWTITYNIIGFPYEKIGSMRDTFNFSRKAGVDFAAFTLLRPEPCSEVYEIFKKEKLLNFDDYYEDPVANSKKFDEINYILNGGGAGNMYFKKEQLRKIHRRFYIFFFIYRLFTYIFMPWRLLYRIGNREELFFFLRLCKNGILIMARLLNPFRIGNRPIVYYVKYDAKKNAEK